MPLRLVFMGTPEFAVPTLAALVSAGHEIVAVYCQPPRPAGRGMAERKSPVQLFAESQDLDVATPTSLRAAAEQERFGSLAADAAVVVAYGLLLPPPVLAAPRQGCLNLHPSKLPRWRGAAPIQRTLMAGDCTTAVTVMRMDEGLDTGPICLEEPVAIDVTTTAGELHDDIAHQGANLMVRALAAMERGTLDCRPQPTDGITYAAKIDKAEARIDWSLPAGKVHDHIRGLSPFPGAWFEVGIGGRPERVKVLRSAIGTGQGAPGEVIGGDFTVACSEGAIRLVELQRAGKKPMTAAEFLRGVALPLGARLA